MPGPIKPLSADSKKLRLNLAGDRIMVKWNPTNGLVCLLWILSGIALASGDHPSPLCQSVIENYTVCRDTRAEIIRISREYESTKPLAMVENGGWVLANNSLVGAVDKRWLAAFSLKDHEPLWWYNTPYPIESPIAVLGGWIVISTLDGSVAKIELATGKKIWEKGVGHFAARSFTLAGSDLFVYTVNHQLYSLNYQSGDTNWIHDANSSVKLTVRNPAPPIVSAAKIYLGTSDGEIQVLDQGSGKVLWQANPAYTDFRFHDVVSDMVLLKNRLVVARYDGVVAAIATDEESHRTIWKNTYASITVSKLHEGALYIGDISGEVRALDAFSGKEIWHVSTGQAISSIVIGEKAIFVAGTKGRIIALSRGPTEEVLWTDDLESPLFAEPLIFDGKIYYASPLKLLYGYKLY